jgi:hypothetical protein
MFQRQDEKHLRFAIYNFRLPEKTPARAGFIQSSIITYQSKIRFGAGGGAVDSHHHFADCQHVRF